MTPVISHLHAKNVIPKTFLQRFPKKILHTNNSQRRFEKENCLVGPRQFFRAPMGAQFITCPPTGV